MAKMFALTKIIMPDDSVIERRTVFDATPAQAKQFDKLKSARPATKVEIENAATALAVSQGQDPAEPELPMAEPKAPASGAPGDPQAAPKGKSA